MRVRDRRADAGFYALRIGEAGEGGGAVRVKQHG